MRESVCMDVFMYACALYVCVCGSVSVWECVCVWMYVCMHLLCMCVCE